MKTTLIILIILLTTQANALQDSFGISDASKMMTRIAGAFSLGFIDSGEYLFLFLIASAISVAVFLLAVLIVAQIFRAARRPQ